MPYYKVIFRLHGGRELEAHHGYVPDIFFDAIQQATTDDIVATYEGGFVWTNTMHEILNVHDTYTSYASVGKEAPEGYDLSPQFADEMLKMLKAANHARPLKEHYNYQLFFMEHIETPPDDD